MPNRHKPDQVCEGAQLHLLGGVRCCVNQPVPQSKASPALRRHAHQGQPCMRCVHHLLLQNIMSSYGSWQRLRKATAHITQVVAKCCQAHAHLRKSVPPAMLLRAVMGTAVDVGLSMPGAAKPDTWRSYPAAAVSIASPGAGCPASDRGR